MLRPTKTNSLTSWDTAYSANRNPIAPSPPVITTRWPSNESVVSLRAGATESGSSLGTHNPSSISMTWSSDESPWIRWIALRMDSWESLVSIAPPQASGSSIDATLAPPHKGASMGDNAGCWSSSLAPCVTSQNTLSALAHWIIAKALEKASICDAQSCWTSSAFPSVRVPSPAARTIRSTPTQSLGCSPQSAWRGFHRIKRTEPTRLAS